MNVKVLTQSNFVPAKKVNQKSQKPSFKAGGALATIGNIMQGIESKGYLASFLIQDGLGMTLPRTVTGFNRDKEITGEYNMQEGKEVFLREGITGPFIIAVAPVVLWLTTKFCRSTNTNTNLIKRFGQSLKDFVGKSNLENSIKQDSKKFRNEFAKFNIDKIYKASVPKDAEAEKTIQKILVEFENLSSKDKKIRNDASNKIVEIFNNRMLETSTDFYHLNKIAVGEGQTKKLFDTKAAINALNDFCEDAITKNPNFAQIDEIAAENIKNNFATKRLATNIANIALTLGGLAVIPKIYATSDISPSARVRQHLESKQNPEAAYKEEETNAVSFKGKGGINSEGIISKIGKILTKYVPEKFSELVEYTGINFTKTTFAALSVFGLLAPRGAKALSRAQVDENGKRDLTEIKEIILRDTTSALSVVFAVPILTKVFVNSYENSKGFILTNKASANSNGFKKFLDVINPYSKLEALSIADLYSIYGNIDSKAKLMNFAKFIDEKGGDLEKILSKSEFVKEVFNEKSFTLESIKNLTKKEKNKKIIDLFEQIKAANPTEKNEMIAKLMKGSGNIKNNKIAQFARGLNSVPGFISTFLISPILLGIFIPELTYAITRNAQKKAAQKEN